MSPPCGVAESAATRRAVQRSGCARAAERLEACLAENSRDFSRCQKEVAALKRCAERQRAVQALAETKKASGCGWARDEARRRRSTTNERSGAEK
jgi:hypothetical protein